MYLTCSAYGVGSFWSSPSPALHADELLGLGEGERCLGLFYMGYFEGDWPEGERETGWVEKVEYIK